MNDSPTSITFNEDCMAVMKRYPDKYFDLAIVDIPYGINVGNMAFLSETFHRIKQRNGNWLNANANKSVYQPKNWDLEVPKQEYIYELKRVSKHQIIFGVESVEWQDLLGNGRIKWLKGFADGVSFKNYELAYSSQIDEEVELPLLWAGMLQAKSINEPMIQQGNKKLNEKRIHPCHKPIMLYELLLKNFANPGYKILDTHLGSGSSRIAAHRRGFDFVGCEIDAEYFTAQEERFEKYMQQQQMFTTSQMAIE